MRSACLLLLSVLAAATADPYSCPHTSLCTLGNALNVTNATGVCDKTNPFWPGTKECTVCAGCHQSLPNCSCCQPAYDNAQSCSLCTVRDAYTRSACGNPQFAFRCDTSGDPPCGAVPGSVEECKDFGKYLCFVRKQSARQAAIATTA